MTDPVHILALYQFTEVADPEALRAATFAKAEALGLRGTLLIAHEGINGTIAGSENAIDAMALWLREEAGFTGLVTNPSVAPEAPFQRLKVKLKKEIVTLGVAGIEPHRQTGQHVPPAEWNELISQPDVLLIDTRNDYEVRIGSFEGAVSPVTSNFREFPEYVQGQLDPARQPRVAMFCTGGIRCEKATAYLISQGFREVYQLEGGILNYLRQTPEDETRWRGECFVFDERVSVTHGLEPGAYEQCFACRRPIGEAEMADPAYQPGVSCPHCIDETDADQRERFAERRRQVELAEARQERHIAASMGEAACAPEPTPDEGASSAA